LVRYKGRGTKKAVKSKSVKKVSVNKSLGSIKTKTHEKKKSSPSSISIKYYVQAGSFSTTPSKEYLLNIKRLGLSYEIRHSNVYKVLIGAYKDENGARSALNKVRKNINSGAFVVKL
jgi:cell division protein FtsN